MSELDLSTIEPLKVEDIPIPDADPFEADAIIGDGSATDEFQGITFEKTKNPELVMLIVPVQYPAGSPERKTFNIAHFIELRYLSPQFKTGIFPTLSKKEQNTYGMRMRTLKQLFASAYKDDKAQVDLTPTGRQDLVGKTVHVVVGQQNNDKSRLEIKKYTPVA